MAESDPSGGKMARVIHIGHILELVHVARDLLKEAGYHGGIRLLVNLVGTKGSVLVGFARTPGQDQKIWVDPFDPRMRDWRELICRDAHLQMEFKAVLRQMNEDAARKVMVDVAQQLSLAYNHKSSPRCFICDTETYPWGEYEPPR